MAAGIRVVGNVVRTTIGPAAMAGFGQMKSILGTTLAPLGALAGKLFGVNAGQAPLKMLTAVFRVLGTAIAGVITVMAYVGAIVFAMASMAMAAWGLFSSGVMGIVDGIVDTVKSIAMEVVSEAVGLVEAGQQMIDGLVEGIENGANAAIDAATNVASDVVSAVKSALHINSPSRVMMEIGAYTSEGFAQGIDRDAPKAKRSMMSMVSVREVHDEVKRAARGGGKGADAHREARSSEGNSITIGPFTISGGKEVAEQVRDAVLDALREAGLSVGSMQEAPAT